MAEKYKNVTKQIMNKYLYYILFALLMLSCTKNSNSIIEYYEIKDNKVAYDQEDFHSLFTKYKFNKITNELTKQESNELNEIINKSKFHQRGGELITCNIIGVFVFPDKCVYLTCNMNQIEIRDSGREISYTHILNDKGYYKLVELIQKIKKRNKNV